MTKFEITAVSLSVLSMLLSVVVALYAGSQNWELSTSDFKAQEQVKSDTAKLLSSLRSIMQKGALSTARKGQVDISHEKKTISEFLTSETGLAYYAWVSEQSSKASKAGRRGEPWRLFFIYLSEISDMDHPYPAARRAADVAALFDKLGEEDIRRISEFNSDLIKAIAAFEPDVVTQAFIALQEKSQEERSPDKLAAKLTYLKTLGIRDPNIDLFLAVLDGESVEAVKAAVEAGADVNMTDAVLLDKYKKELENFRPTDSPAQ